MAFRRRTVGMVACMLAVAIAAAGPCLAAGADQFNVRDFGAVGDGRSLDTAVLQKAIDRCATAGGVVYVPGGKYLTGTLFLRSNVTLHLAAAATLLGSPEPEHYSTAVERCGFVRETAIDRCLIYAAGAKNIAITGRGTIDGQGRSFPLNRTDGRPVVRPMLIRMVECQNVSVEGVTLANAAAWCFHLLRCDGARVRGVSIYNRANGNNDGIDLMSTRNVQISDCTIECEDDAICFQDMSHELPVENITISNCVMSTRWAAIRSGGAHRGGIRNVTATNCVIRDTYGCGIKLQISGNGTMEDMTFSNIVMKNVSCPISLRFGNHHYNGEQRDPAFPMGTMRNLMFSNIRASVVDEATLRKGIRSFAHVNPNAVNPYPGEERQCISICGIPGRPVEGVTLSDIHVTYPGGGTREDAARRDLPEMADVYPEYFMWGVLPAYGLYARHAKGLTLSNVRFELASPDLRPAVVCDDVDEVSIAGLRAAADRQVESLVRLRNVRSAYLYGCRPLGPIGTFVRLEGKDCRDLLLGDNDLHQAGRPVDLADGAPNAAVVPRGRRMPAQ